MFRRIKPVNQSRFEFIIEWMEHIEKLRNFYCSIEPDYYEEPYYPEREYGNPDSPRCYDQFWEEEWYYPTEEMEFHISDEEDNNLIIYVPLDGISSTHVYFTNSHLGICMEGDVDLSIIESLKRLIERFPDSFFYSEIRAAIYYSNTGNLKKAIDYIRLYLESEYQPYNLEQIQMVFPAKFRNLDEFKRLLRLSIRQES